MDKKPLKKLFHIDKEAYKSEYEKKFNDEDTIHLDIEISGNPAFICQTKEMFGSIISIERLYFYKKEYIQNGRNP